MVQGKLAYLIDQTLGIRRVKGISAISSDVYCCRARYDTFLKLQLFFRQIVSKKGLIIGSSYPLGLHIIIIGYQVENPS